MTEKQDYVDPDKHPYYRVMKDIVLPICLAAMVALPGVVAAYRTARTNEKVDEVHQMVNSRLTQMLKMTKEQAFQEGVKHGKEDHDDTN